MEFGADQSALIFLFPRFSASNEPTGVDSELWSTGEGGRGGLSRAIMKVS